MKRNRTFLSFWLTTATLAAAVFAGANVAGAQSPYRVITQWNVGGNTKWDYLAQDPVSKLLYVTHGDRVEIIDTTLGKVTAEITGLKGIHGVAFDTSGKFGYITDGGANEVVVFDRKTNNVVAHVPAGDKPDGIVFEPVTQTVWAFNGKSNTATVISDATHRVVATVSLPGKPEFPVADGKGSIYDNIEDLSEIAHIDAKTDKVLAVWSTAPCEGPTGLAIDKQHDRLFAVCDGKMAIVDARTGKVVATPSIGGSPDAARFDAKRQLVFSSNGDGTLTVIHEDSPNSYSVLQTLATKSGARTLEEDEASGNLYVVTADFEPGSDATPGHRQIAPGSFVMLVVGRDAEK